MSDSFCRIEVSDIDLTDLRYDIGSNDGGQGDNQVTSAYLDTLSRSIHALGPASPPIVRQEADRYILISGFNRVKALTLSGSKTVWVLKAAPGTSELDCLKRAIAVKAFNRPLSPFELIRAVTLLSGFISSKEICGQAPLLFNTALNRGYIDQLNEIAKLPDPALALIQAGRLSVKATKKLLEFPGDDIRIFLSIFERLNASSSKQLEMILFLKEIAARDKISIRDASFQLNLSQILDDGSTDAAAKLRQLREKLYSSRFPELSKKYTRVQQVVQSLKLGKGIKFTPPENFEHPSYTLSFQSDSLEDFLAKVSRISQCAKGDAIKEIFDP